MIKLLIVVPSYPKTSGVDYHRLLNASPGDVRPFQR